MARSGVAVERGPGGNAHRASRGPVWLTRRGGACVAVGRWRTVVLGPVSSSEPAHPAAYMTLGH